MKAIQQTERRHNVRLLFPLGLMLLVAVFWTGCKQETKASAQPDITGNYTLTAVDGKQVPCTINHEGASPTIKSGLFVISPDGTCSSKIEFSMASGPVTTREVKATYVREGSKLTMKWESAGTTLGVVQGNTFTMTNEGMVLAYSK